MSSRVKTCDLMKKPYSYCTFFASGLYVLASQRRALVFKQRTSNGPLQKVRALRSTTKQRRQYLLFTA
jgi:hypothetical protein